MRLSKRPSTAAITSLLLVTLMFSSALGEVYLNRQWDEQDEEWYTGTLFLEGKGLSINREYQNAFGLAMELEPGPPFYIEAPIAISNLYDEEHRVTDWGGFSISSEGSGGDPSFEVIFISSDPTDNRISTSGNLHCTGTSSDPVIFKGPGVIKSGCNMSVWDRDSMDDMTVTFEYCRFDDLAAMAGGQEPLDFDCGHLTLENCTIEGFGQDNFTILNFFDDAYQYHERQWKFAMRECTDQLK